MSDRGQGERPLGGDGARALSGTEGRSGAAGRRPLSVAVVGLACRSPGAADLAEFADRLLAGGEAEPGELRTAFRVDPDRPGLTGPDAERLGPWWLLALDAALSALEDAGLPPGFPAGRRSRIYAVDRPSGIGEGTLASTLADRLGASGGGADLRGGASAGLAAAELAARDLHARRADLAIVVAAGDEGVAAIALRRLADAERRGQRTYALIRGAGLTGPGNRAARRALARSARSAGVLPEALGLLAGVGAGSTPLTGPWPRLALDSVAGRADALAGLAGLIGASAALHHRLQPQERPGVTGYWYEPSSRPRRAAVVAAESPGFAASIVLEEHAASADDPTAPGALGCWDAEAILLGAPDRRTWIELASALRERLLEGDAALMPLRDLAATLNLGQPAFPFRVGMVARTPAELSDRLREGAERLADPAVTRLDGEDGLFLVQDSSGPGPPRLGLIASAGSVGFAAAVEAFLPHAPEARPAFEAARQAGVEESGAGLCAGLGWLRLLASLGVRFDAAAGGGDGRGLALALAVAGAFRGRQLDARIAALAADPDAELGGIPMVAARIPVYAGSRLPVEPDALRLAASSAMANPPGRDDTLAAMRRDGIGLFLDVGGDEPGAAADVVTPWRPGRTGAEALTHLVAALFARGIDIRVEALYRRRPVRTIDLGPSRPAVPAIRLPIGLAEADAGRYARPVGLDPSSALDELARLAGDDEAAAAYVATMTEFLDVQRRVAGAYLKRVGRGPSDGRGG